MRWRCDQKWKVEEEKECTLPCSFASPCAAAWELGTGGGGAGVGARRRTGNERRFRGARAFTSGHRLLPVAFPTPLPPNPYRQEAEVKKAYPGCLLTTPGGHGTQPADSGSARLSGWACCSHGCPARDPGRTDIVRMSAKDRIEIFPSRM